MKQAFYFYDIYFINSIIIQHKNEAHLSYKFALNVHNQCSKTWDLEPVYQLINLYDIISLNKLISLYF